MAFDQSIIGKDLSDFHFDYDWRDTALYALACGATPEELDLLLETRGPKVLPTFAVVACFEPLLDLLHKFGGNPATLVHGGQRCVFHQPLKPKAKLKTNARASALYDKGKGALAIFTTKTVDETGAPAFDTEWQIFFRGEGGFGGEKSPDAPSYRPPEGKAPDFTRAMPTAPNQALLYRLASRDFNPIHSDPDFAQKVGFPKPILHGLCTFGHAARAASLELCGGDVSALKSIEGRFSKPVFPGDTIETRLWKIADGEAYFVSKVAERSQDVITLGRVLYTP